MIEEPTAREAYALAISFARVLADGDPRGATLQWLRLSGQRQLSAATALACLASLTWPTPQCWDDLLAAVQRATADQDLSQIGPEAMQAALHRLRGQPTPPGSGILVR